MRPANGFSHYPQAPGKCALCRRDILEARDSSVQRVDGRLRLTCRNGKECLAARKAAAVRR